MTPVRMAHPNHGFMHAYTTDEIKNLEALGWEVEKPAVEILESPSAEVLTTAPKRKYTKRQAA